MVQEQRPAAASVDLSEEISQTVEKQPSDRVRCTRISVDTYRCNWWAPDKSPQSFWLASGTIRRSRFVRATKNTDGLLIEDVTKAAEE